MQKTPKIGVVSGYITNLRQKHNHWVLMIKFLLNRLRTREDTEHRQHGVRIIFGFMCLFLIWSLVEDTDKFYEFLRLSILYFLSTISLFIWLLISPTVSISRRIIGILMEPYLIGIAFYELGPEVLPIIVFNVGAILGHGFRYGMSYLFFSMALSIVGFTINIFLNPFWQDNLTLTTTMLLVLVIPPIYCSRLIKMLNTTIEGEKQANETKSQFIANISHELRTPLNNIIGSLDLAHSDNDISKKNRYIKYADDAAVMMLTLVNDTLDLSKLNKNKTTQEFEVFNITSLLDRHKSVFEPECTKKKLYFNIFIDNKLPLDVFGPHHHLDRILTNVVGNAIKFTSAGGITINVSIQKGLYLFEVIDTGIGIHNDLLETVFDDFTQADESHTREYGGTGLGLSICKKLLALYEGSICLSSEINKGTTTFITIPLQQSKETSMKSEPLITINNDNYRYTNLSVLIADDNETNLIVLEDQLASANHMPTRSMNGKEAFLFAENNKYDLIILDMQMPIITGTDAAKKIKQTKLNQSTPIIILTANTDHSVKQICDDIGVDLLLNKPIRKDFLLRSIESIMTNDSIKLSNKDDIESDSILDIDLINERIKIYMPLNIRIEDLFQELRIELKFLINNLDNNDAIETLHSLIGSAGNVGAIKLSAHMRIVYNKMKNDIEVESADITVIKNTLDETEQALEQYFIHHYA